LFATKAVDDHVRALRIRRWLLIAGYIAIAAGAYCTIHLRSRAQANPRAVASAQDEVYEAVVRDVGPLRVWQPLHS